MLRPRLPVKQAGPHAAEVSNVKTSRERPASWDPLSDSEFSELETVLATTHLGLGMNVEELDGFFAALLAGPPVEKPCQFWPVVLGKDVGDPAALAFIRTTTSLLPLFARHWESISQTLLRGGVHVPYLTVDSDGVALARDWARGFMRAVELRAACWQPLINDDHSVAALLPMMILAHEDDPNPRLRPPALSSVQREALIKHMTVGLIRAHRFFAQAPSSATVSSPANLH